MEFREITRFVKQDRLRSVADLRAVYNPDVGTRVSEQSVQRSLLKIASCLMSFQADNCPCHKARIVLQACEEHDSELTLMSYPPNSPDLNPNGTLHGFVIYGNCVKCAQSSGNKPRTC